MVLSLGYSTNTEGETEMMNGNWGASGGWMIVGGAMMLAFWAVVFWAVVSFVRRPTETGTRTRTAEEILAERFARGDLDADEFQQRRQALQAH